MPSPFPGMDPWLEVSGLFPDFHQSLNAVCREVLNSVLPQDYRATTCFLVYVAEEQLRDPDVSVYGPASATSAVVMQEYIGLLDLTVATEPVEEPYIEIRTIDGDRLVTALEVLSPSNKMSGSPGREAYIRKQEEFLSRGVNLVEMDLLRSGKHTTAISRATLKSRSGLADFAYHIAVNIAAPKPRSLGAAIGLRDRLPTISIPLDPGIAPVTIDLQAAVDRVFDGGRYAMSVKYNREVKPSLSPGDQAWATEILRAKQLLS